MASFDRMIRAFIPRYPHPRGWNRNFVKVPFSSGLDHFGMIDDNPSCVGDPSMDDPRGRPFGPATSMGAATGSRDGRDPRQLDLWSALRPETHAFEPAEASVSPRQPPSAASGDRTQSNRALRRKAGSLLIDPAGVPVPAITPAWDEGIRIDQRNEFVIPGLSASAVSFRPALVAGALLAVLFLGWAVGWSSYRWLAPTPASTPVNQLSASDCTLNSGKEVGCVSVKSDREAIVGTVSTQKVAAPTGAGRGHEPSRGGAQQAVASGKRDASPAQQNTSSPASAASQDRVKTAPRLVPVPETRPTTIAGWTVREVIGGTAVLDGPDGSWRARSGDTVPGVGRVDSIVRWGNRWIVATTKGLISTPN